MLNKYQLLLPSSLALDGSSVYYMEKRGRKKTNERELHLFLSFFHLFYINILLGQQFKCCSESIILKALVNMYPNLNYKILEGRVNFFHFFSIFTV